MALGIDIGNSKIKLIELNENQENISLASHAMNDVMEDMKIYDPEKIAKANWVASIDTIVKNLGINSKKTKNLISSIPGIRTSIKQLTTLEMNKEELSQSLEFEAKKHIPLDGTEAVLDYHILGSNIKEIDKIDVLLIATTKNIISQHSQILKDAGFKPEVFDTDPIALANCMTYNYDLSDNGCDVIIDIGHLSTSLIVWGNEKPFYNREIEISGHHMVKEIINKLECDYAKGLDELNKNGVNCSTQTTDNNTETSNPFNIKIAEKNVFSNLIDELRKSLRYYMKTNGQTPFKRFFLSGGYSKLPGLEEYFNNQLNIEIELLNPFNKIEGASDIDNPSIYSTAVGLALRGMKK